MALVWVSKTRKTMLRGEKWEAANLGGALCNELRMCEQLRAALKNAQTLRACPITNWTLGCIPMNRYDVLSVDQQVRSIAVPS